MHFSQVMTKTVVFLLEGGVWLFGPHLHKKKQAYKRNSDKKLNGQNCEDLQSKIIWL